MLLYNDTSIDSAIEQWVIKIAAQAVNDGSGAHGTRWYDSAGIAELANGDFVAIAEVYNDCFVG